MRRSVGSYAEDNLKSARAAGDDTGLPESPVYSNFSRHLWRTHTRLGLERSPEGPREKTDDLRRPAAAGGGKGEGAVKHPRGR